MHMRPLAPGAVWKHRDQLLSFCDAYGLSSVASHALHRLHDIVDKDPWGTFCLASHRNDLGLAKAALRAMAVNPVHYTHVKPRPPPQRVDLLAIRPKEAEMVSTPYLLGLFYAAMQVVMQGGAVMGPTDQEGAADEGKVWKVIGDKFKPIVA